MVRWLQKPGLPRVGLVGFYGFGNYGDELFVDAFREHLGGQLDIRVLPDLTVSPYFSRPVRKVVHDVDAIIIGGGDLVVPWKLSPLYWNRAYLDRPVYISGVGVAQLQSTEPNVTTVRALQQFFQHRNVRYISARDATSARWIEMHLAPKVPVVLAPDLVCSVTLPSVAAQEDTFGIVTRHRAGHQDDYAVVQELANRALAKGMRARHIVLGIGNTGAKDLEHATELLVPDKQVVHSESLDDLSRAIGTCRVLASMKFHGTVVASMYGVPSISMMPTVKSVRYLNALGRPELVSHFAKQSLLDLIDTIPERIDPLVVSRLRAESRAALVDLSEHILSGR